MTRTKLLLYLLVISTRFVANTVAIIGGQNAKTHQFSYQVSVQALGSNHGCGGSIISEQHILTAAHCVVNSNFNMTGQHIFIRAGTNYLHYTSSGVSVDVKKIFVPTEYSPKDTVGVADIAVLMLKHPLKFSDSISKVELPGENRENYARKKVKISGFGWTWIDMHGKEEDGSNPDGRLYFAEADVLTPTRCKKLLRKTPITDKHICAKVYQRDAFKTSGVCTGDSGGSLVSDNRTVIGVLSVNHIGCSEVKYPAVYTRVTSYLDFIEHVLHDKEPSKHKDIRQIELH